MASKIRDALFNPAAIFISYSHADEALREKLEKHLSALNRSGLISTWHDRRIGPGDEWKKEIDANLFRADIILLLLSADFLASDFCYVTETRNALDRHARGQVTVIPVVLRPVDLRGLPIADLQMVPKDGQPVTSKYWASEDEAFKNVAEGIRAVIENIADRRWRGLESEERRGTVTEARALDAAVSREIPVGEAREVVALVRVSESKGLRGILPAQLSHTSDYSCTSSDVRSEAFHAKYAPSAAGEFSSPEYRLTVHAPEMSINEEDRKFELEPMHDSIVFKFLVTAQKPGQHRLRVNLFSKNSAVAEALLRTVSHGPPGPKGGGVSKFVASVELLVRAISKSASVGGN